MGHLSKWKMYLFFTKCWNKYRVSTELIVAGDCSCSKAVFLLCTGLCEEDEQVTALHNIDNPGKGVNGLYESAQLPGKITKHFIAKLKVPWRQYWTELWSMMAGIKGFRDTGWNPRMTDICTSSGRFYTFINCTDSKKKKKRTSSMALHSVWNG